MALREALIEVRGEVGAIGKSEKNTAQNFMFRGVDQILNKVGPALARNGINCYPELRSLESRDIVTGKGTRMREVTVQVAYHYELGDEEIVAVVPGESADAGDKAVSKAMSVALRTAHIQTLQIPTGGVDPDAQTVKRATDPLMKVKADIWAEASKRGWIEQGEHGETFDELQADFALWSEGGQIADGDLDTLQKYLTHLKPKRTMKRGDS